MFETLAAFDRLNLQAGCGNDDRWELADRCVAVRPAILGFSCI